MRDYFRYYLRWMSGGSLASKQEQLLAHLFCFLFGHDVPCGTGGGLCQRCYKVMALCRDKRGLWSEPGLKNPLATSLRDFYDFLFIRAKYKFWVRTF